MKKIVGILVVCLMVGMVFVGGISFRSSGDNANIRYDDKSRSANRLGVEIPICINSSVQVWPNIYDDKIVWLDSRSGRSIYIYDLSTNTETFVTGSDLSLGAPAIYGDKIVWHDDKDTTGCDIYMYDLSTGMTTQITSSPGHEMCPDIYGDKIIWWDEDCIGVYNLTTDTETCVANQSTPVFPAIYDDKIVYMKNISGNCDIYLYDLSTQNEIQITTAPSLQSCPTIYEDKIVWIDFRNDNPDIYMYNLSSGIETPICTNVSSQAWLEYPHTSSIYDDKIVWEDNRSGNWDIYMYDLSTQTESVICSNPSDQYFPKIYNNKIVWVDNRSGNWDIYMYDLKGGAANQPPTAFIDSITPNPAVQGQSVSFAGYGTDPDGDVVAYNWRSSIGGQLSTSASFSTSTLSVGTHTIYFKVQDDNSTWSDEVSETLEITSSGELTTHNPIYINGNSDFTFENGVSNPTAAGTEDDPYIIGNWDINASSANGIEIRNTDMYFTIRNCVIYDGKSNSKSGIYFNGVQNGKIENVTSYNNIDGIRLWSSSNNTVTNCNVYNNYFGIYLDEFSNNNTITNCTAYNSTHHGISLCVSLNNNIASNQIYNNYNGIRLFASPNNILRNNTLENNTYNFGVFGAGLVGMYVSLAAYYQDIDTSNTINSKPIYYIIEQSNLMCDGIEIGYLGLVSCSNITIKNLNLTNNRQGLLLANTSYSNIASNQIYNNCNDGILLAFSSNNNNISNCAVYNNYYYGIRLYSSSNNTVTNCSVYNNSYIGVELDDSSNNQIINCAVYNNDDYGIELDDYSNNNSISNCTIYNNSYYGIRLDDSSNNQIHYNNIYDNTDYGIHNLNSGSQYEVNATYNWWGDASGPYQYTLNPDGTGDRVSNNVIFDPWLTEPWSELPNQLPTVSITSPFSDSTVLGAITVQGTASDPDGTVQSVQVSIDDNTFSSGLLTVTGTTSWSASWDTTTVSNTGHTIYARSYDGTDYSSIDSITLTVNNVAGADTTPPTITHTPVVSAEEGKPITITATITDDVGVTSATLYYRKTGDTSYTSIAMANPSGNTWTATIPASAVTTLGVEYYISATDGVNTATHPATNPTTSPHAIVVTQVVTETFEDPDTGATVTAQYTGTGNITITSASSPGPPPSGVHGINIFVNIIVPDTMTIQWVYIVVPYNEDDLPAGVDESKLKLFYWTDTGWEKCENTDVDTTNNVVYANVTHFTIFAPMAEKTAAGEEGVNWLLYIGTAAIVAVMIAGAVIVMKKKKTKG